MHRIILSWTISNVKVLRYFKLNRTLKLYRQPSHALSNKPDVIGFYSWDFFQQRNFAQYLMICVNIKKKGGKN